MLCFRSDLVLMLLSLVQTRLKCSLSDGERKQKHELTELRLTISNVVTSTNYRQRWLNSLDHLTKY